MKRIDGFILTLALLMVVQGAWAQTTGTLSHEGHKMKFSISGVKITDKGEVNYQGPVYDRTDGDLLVEMKGTVKKGATVKAEAIKVSGVDMPRIGIFFYPSKPGQMNILGWQDLSERNFPKVTSNSGSFTVPDDVDWLRVVILYQTPKKGRRIHLDISLKVEDETPPTQPITIDNCNCDYIRDDIGYNLIDSHIRFNDFYGEVKMRPNWLEDDSYEFVDIDSPIYECYRIKTEEDSGAILGLEDMSTYVMKPETTLIIRTEEDNTSRFELIVGTLWGNVKKMIRGESIECEMSQCVSGISGTIVAWEEKNGISSVYLFAGKVDVTSKKTKKKQVLQPGQTSSVGKDGKIVVKKFNIEQGAKKFGIPMSEIRNHYSNTTTTATAKRYEMERAIVKYKVTKGSEEGVMAKCFDNYGQLERRELKMNNQTTLQLTQGSNSYSLDTQAKTYTQVTNAELNFLNMNDPVMQKLKLKKKGTAKVLNRECTIYANSDTEFYVWKGIVLKKAAHTKKGTTTTEATSVELPTSVDSKYFNMPAGYRKK